MLIYQDIAYAECGPISEWMSCINGSRIKFFFRKHNKMIRVNVAEKSAADRYTLYSYDDKLSEHVQEDFKIYERSWTEAEFLTEEAEVL